MMLAKDFLDGRNFGIFISVLIFYSLVTFSMETLPDLDESTLIFLKYSEVVVVAIFTLEYLCRVMVAENKIKFIFSFYGLIDLLAIIPFYLATSVDLRTLRLLR
jgi:voltage-gated potassium channel